MSLTLPSMRRSSRSRMPCWRQPWYLAPMSLSVNTRSRSGLLGAVIPILLAKEKRCRPKFSTVPLRGQAPLLDLLHDRAEFLLVDADQGQRDREHDRAEEQADRAEQAQAAEQREQDQHRM